MGKYKRSLRNIYKQYGKHIKVWEEKEKSLEDSKETLEFYEKYGLDIVSRKPFISIRHYRWGNCVPKQRQVDTFEKLKVIALEK